MLWPGGCDMYVYDKIPFVELMVLGYNPKSADMHMRAG